MDPEAIHIVSPQQAPKEEAGILNKLPSPKKPSLLMVILVLIAVFALGTSIYFANKIKILKEEATLTPQTQTEKPTNQAVNSDLVNWKTYSNEEYSFESKYHPERTPSEYVGNEGEGQFSYLLSIQFGLAPLKNRYGYLLEISKKSLEDYRKELIGHVTNNIESEEQRNLNGISWTIIHYEQFISTDYVPVITAFTNHSDYSYVITTADYDTDQILSTFQFLN